MQPIDPEVYYGIVDRDYLDLDEVQMDLLPDKLSRNRSMRLARRSAKTAG